VKAATNGAAISANHSALLLLLLLLLLQVGSYLAAAEACVTAVIHI
jgi:hypothetical protein